MGDKKMKKMLSFLFMFALFGVLVKGQRMTSSGQYQYHSDYFKVNASSAKEAEAIAEGKYNAKFRGYFKIISSKATELKY